VVHKRGKVGSFERQMCQIKCPSQLDQARVIDTVKKYDRYRVCRSMPKLSFHYRTYITIVLLLTRFKLLSLTKNRKPAEYLDTKLLVKFSLL
jgi:hypothetical protein